MIPSSDKLQFEWDDRKNQTNIKKHGISFETAAFVFTDPYYVVLFDEDHSLEEDRFYVLGTVQDILFVVFTLRNETIRLISARLATRQERRFYYDRQL